MIFILSSFCFFFISIHLSFVFSSFIFFPCLLFIFLYISLPSPLFISFLSIFHSPFLLFLPYFFSGKMTSVELLADALRFFLLYTLLPNGAIAVSLEDAAVIGAVAGIANQLVRIALLLILLLLLVLTLFILFYFILLYFTFFFYLFIYLF